VFWRLTLKGACANIRAHSLLALAQRLEADSSTADVQSLESCNILLRQEFERTKQFLSDPSVTPGPAQAAS
jgi:HPt (histidine-containing phosphotransfer) domain-containing protein